MSRLLPSLRHATLMSLLALCVGGPSAAPAAPLPIAACNSASNAATHAWAPMRTASNSQLELVGSCPTSVPDPYSGMSSGLAVIDVINAADEAAPDGSYAEWRFVAPSGTAIVSASITRDIGNRDEWTPYGRIDGIDQPGESCMPGMGEAFCRIQGTRVFSALDARTIAYGVRCEVAPYCAHGATLRSVWALILGATVTLDDREAPVVSAVQPSGLADGQWKRGSGSVAFSASDNTGVRERRVVVDGVERAVMLAPGAAAGGCRDVGQGPAYSYPRPCADGRGVNGVIAMTASPCAWGDGPHLVRGGATDTGGLRSQSPSAVTVRVDCTAPDVRVGVEAVEAVEGFPIEPVVTGSDATSGLAQTVVQVSVDSGPWESYTGAIGAAAGRSYQFRARAFDVAGNASGWAYSGTVWGVAAEVPEGAPPDAPAVEDPAVEDPAVEDPALEDPAVEDPAVEDTAAEGPAGQNPAAEEAAMPRPPLERLAKLPPQTDEPGQPATFTITRVRIRRSGAVTVEGTAPSDRPLTVRLRTNTRAMKRRASPIEGRWRLSFPLKPRERVRSITADTARWRAGRAKPSSGLAA